MLLWAFSDHCSCDREADIELLRNLGGETSGELLADLVRAGVVAPEEALRVGLEVLRHLTEVCTSEAESVLERPAPAAG